MTDEQLQRAPYPGLRAFRREETDLFFGREDCTNAMVDRLAATHFLAVLGSSGTGKSSLVRTGLLDALELGLMAKAGSRWKIVDFRPGGSPLKNLAKRLLETEHDAANPYIEPKDVDLLRAYLARGPRAVLEWCRSGHLPPGGNLLLLVDQFEELFRYQDYAGREEAEAFVALLLESAREKDARVYVTITMRSEYLGACALIEGLSDAINAGMFLTPRMTREHCREAIAGPAEVCDIEIEPALVNRLLNDLANFAPWDSQDTNDQLDRLMRRADQLPLLQYTLNRMWQRAHDREPGKQVKLTVGDYDAIGGLSGALNAHADQIFDDLGKPRAQVAEWVFRALTAGSTIADAVRRPTRLDDLISASGGDEAGVRAVVDAFRAPGVNFLLPEFDPNNPKLAPDTYIDISHESLIRQWKKLSEWLGAEGRAAQQWRRLVDRFGTGEVLRGRELTNLIAWRKETKPNAAWAKRYGGDYPAVIGFLDKSQRAQTTKRAAVIVSIVAVFVLVGAFGIDANLQRHTISKQSGELKQQLQATQTMQTRAELNRKQFLDLLEEVIFNLAESPGATDVGARRVSDSAQTPDRPDGGEQELPGGPEPTGDRPATETPVARPTNPTLATLTIAVERTRGLLKTDPNDTDFRRLLGVSLRKIGESRHSGNDLPGAQVAYGESVEIVRALVQDNPGHRSILLWKDDLALTLAGLARVHIRRDNQKATRPFLQEAGDIELEFAKGRPPDRQLINLQRHLGELGDLYIRLGDRRAAHKAFDERLQIRRRRLAVAPGDTQRQTDLSIALDRVGQSIREQGDLNGSRVYFEEALQIDRALNKRAPTRRDWQENLVFSLTRLGDLERQLGRQSAALLPYEEALGFQRKLSSDVTVISPQQTLASLLGKIGDIKRRLKEYPAAIASHREELDIRRRLLVRDPGSLSARRNVSSALDYLGNTLRESGDLAGARAAFNEQLDLDRAIAKDDPNNTTSLTDLAWSLNRVGDLDRDASKPTEAAKYYEEALAIQRKLIARDTDNVVRMRALASIVAKLGSVRSRLSDYTTALTLHQEELDLRRKLNARAADDDNDALRDLSLALDRVGNVLRDMSDYRGALKYFEEELATDRSFLARAPNNQTALTDVQWTLNKLVDYVRQRLNDRPAALKYLREMIGIDRRLVDREPASKSHNRRLKDDLTKLANLQLDLNDQAGARDAHADVVAALERWLGIVRENFRKVASEENRGEVVNTLGDAGWNALLAGRAEAALPHIEAALSFNPDWVPNMVNLGHVHLFQGRYAEAMKLYASVRDRYRDDPKRTFGQEIKDDFARFRRLGLGRPDMARVERELKL